MPIAGHPCGIYFGTIIFPVCGPVGVIGCVVLP
jgi:hypothetical protein